jgi:hydrogenase nickel incorporation protein HypB
MSEPRILQVRTKILKKNDELARTMRDQFCQAQVLVVNLVSSPGSGKTSWLLETLRYFVTAGTRVAAVVGDLETDNDARRLSESGAPVRQIMTHGMCHLEAEMVHRHLDQWDLKTLQYLFIENVGNLVCPTSWDLGESVRAALLSVTEGEDKPLKYPGLFNTADIAIITKSDLSAPCEFDRDQTLRNIDRVRPGLQVIESSAKTGLGLAEWIAYLQSRRAELADKH